MRIQSIDVARGLCIVLVVWGHNPVFTDSVINHVLGSMRMPMMFFIAGSFVDARMSWKQLALQKADALMKPFVFAALLQAPARIYLGETNVPSLVTGLVAGGGYYLPWVFYLWYLPHLWLLFLVGQPIIRLGRLDDWSADNKLAFIYALMFVGISLSLVLPGVPYKLDTLPRDLSYFILGYLARDAMRQWRFSWRVLLLSLLVLTGAQLLLQMSIRDAATPQASALLMISSVSGIVGLGTLACGLADLRFASRVLSLCGRDSLFILLFHWPLQTLGGLIWRPLCGESLILLTGALSWLTSITLCLLVAQVIRRHAGLAVFWLPIQTVRKASRRALAPTLAPASEPAPADALSPAKAS